MPSTFEKLKPLLVLSALNKSPFRIRKMALRSRTEIYPSGDFTLTNQQINFLFKNSDSAFQLYVVAILILLTLERNCEYSVNVYSMYTYLNFKYLFLLCLFLRTVPSICLCPFIKKELSSIFPQVVSSIFYRVLISCSFFCLLVSV